MNPDERDRFTDGLLSPRQTALLLGVTEQQLRQQWERQRAAEPDLTSMNVPKAWIRQGQEIAARPGADSVEEALRLLEAEQAQ